MQNNKQSQVILPNQTIGIIGGGQLGRMMAISARYMGYKIVVLDPTPNCPTAQVADQQIVAAYDDMEAIQELTELSDVVTYEFENVDLNAARYIENKSKLPQGAYALEITQNREKEKTLIKELGLPVPTFAIVNNAAETEQALSDFPLPAVIKTCRGGYDGKGQLKIESADQIKEAAQFAELHGQNGTKCIIEQWIRFDKEMSVVFSRAQNGDITFFPISENEHKHHILHKTTVPAHVSQTVLEQAYEAATLLGEKMNIVGTFAIEMFVKGDDIYINEMAPRPHNSGHYSIEACNVSQFDQHIRAICGLPLPKIELLKPAIMINILGEDLDHALAYIKTHREGSLHLYGKEEAKAQRKMGHITFTGTSVDDVLHKVKTYEEGIII